MRWRAGRGRLKFSYNETSPECGEFIGMSQPRDLPLLAVLPADKFLLHEKHDQQRSPQLLEDLRSSGLLRNPPIVAPLHDRTGRYLVLDGAHRVLSLIKLGIAHILAQVVEPDDPGLAVHPWNHVLWGPGSQEFAAALESIPGLLLESADPKTSTEMLTSRRALALILWPDGTIMMARPPASDRLTRVKYLNAIVDGYPPKAYMDRTNLSSLTQLTKLYPELSALVILPSFSVEEVLYLASEGQLLPTGSTRFTISPRALHVNYPLSELGSGKSLMEKNAALHAWLQERLANKHVRYYAEATYLFDE